MALRLLSKTLQLVLIFGTGLMILFILLSGGVNHYPFDELYWVQGDTSAIAGAPQTSRWTYWGLANVVNDKSVEVQFAPAYPISPVDNFDTTVNVPPKFVSNRDTFYYLSRTGFGLYWAAFAFVGVSMFTTFFSFCFESNIKFSAWLISGALILIAAASSIQTAAAVLAKNAFSDAGLYGRVGRSLLGLTWGSTAALIILFFLSCSGAIKSSYGKYREELAANQAKQQEYLVTESADGAAPAAANEPYPPQNQGTLAGQESGIKFFKIRRHNKEDTESV